jgi:hypothetical protein
MNSIIKLIFVFVIIAVLSQSCYYDKAYDLLPGIEPCDTTSVTYNNQVKPIMLQYCMDCHSTENHSAGVILDTYEGTKIIADDGKLIGVINHKSGFSPMPKNAPQLDPCTIRIIELWVEDGAPDN